MEKVLFISDQQIPYQDDRAIALSHRVSKSMKFDYVVYVGDWADHNFLGRWVHGGTREFLNQLANEKIDINDENVILEMYKKSQDARDYFEECRKISPNAKMIAMGGNHDMTRVYNYFDVKRPSALEYLTPETLWGFNSLGIEFHEYEEPPLHFMADVYLHHGIAISQDAGESVRKDMNKFGVSLVRAHSHRQAIVSRNYPLLNKTIVGIECGHMMDTNSSGASYDSAHNWNLGFCVGYISDDATDTSDGKRIDFELVPISRDYTCVVGGKLYKG